MGRHDRDGLSSVMGNKLCWILVGVMSYTWVIVSSHERNGLSSVMVIIGDGLSWISMNVVGYHL